MIAMDFFGGVLASLTAALFHPVLRNTLVATARQIVQSINPNAMSLTGHWEAAFSEPSRDSNSIDSNEKIRLTQRGNILIGESELGDPYPRSFAYRAEIYHDLVWGTYRNSKEQKGAVSGRGVFLLEISKDRKSMEGFCTWMDNDTKKIESSKYVWKRL
jgi:hypothetical protein